MFVPLSAGIATQTVKTPQALYFVLVGLLADYLSRWIRLQLLRCISAVISRRLQRRETRLSLYKNGFDCPILQEFQSQGSCCIGDDADGRRILRISSLKDTALSVHKTARKGKLSYNPHHKRSLRNIPGSQSTRLFLTDPLDSRILWTELSYLASLQAGFPGREMGRSNAPWATLPFREGSVCLAFDHRERCTTDG